MAARGRGTTFGPSGGPNRGSEIARQDVMVTRDGPIELMKRDIHGNFNQVPREHVNFLSNKYRSCNRPDDYRPIETNHGPGLYRNHISVKGDAVHMRKMNRNFIYHRRPFDWYNGNRFNLIDDVEEVLEPNGSGYETGGHISKYDKHRNNYSSNDYKYDPNDKYSSRSASRSQSRNCGCKCRSRERSRDQSSRSRDQSCRSRDQSCRSRDQSGRDTSVETRSPTREPRKDFDDDTIYIVKKKEPEVKFSQEPLKPAIKYEYPKYESPKYVAPSPPTPPPIQSQVSYNMSKEYTKTLPGSSVVYHGSSTTSGTTNFTSNMPTMTSYSSQLNHSRDGLDYSSMNNIIKSPVSTSYKSYSSGGNNSQVIYHGNNGNGSSTGVNISPIASNSNYSHSIDSSNYSSNNKPINSSKVLYQNSNYQNINGANQAKSYVIK